MTSRTRARIVIAIVIALLVPAITWGAYTFMYDSALVIQEQVCGDAVCDLGEAGSCAEDCPNVIQGEEIDVTPLPGPASAMGYKDVCVPEQTAFNNLITKKETTQCQTDADCTQVSASCTCAMGVNVETATELRSTMDALMSCWRNSGQSFPCADCAMMKVSCEEGVCKAH